MPVVFALEDLYAKVGAAFEAEGLEVEQVFGPAGPSGNFRGERRVCWVPGDEGNAGTVLGASGPGGPGGNPRSLATFRELAVLHIGAVDRAAKDQKVQYNAARRLFDHVVRHLRNAAPGNVFFEGVRWNWPNNEAGRGAEIQLVIAIDSPVFDRPAVTAPEGTEAVIAVRLNSVEEPVSTEEDSP